jgi:hypothetical protein
MLCPWVEAQTKVSQLEVKSVVEIASQPSTRGCEKAARAWRPCPAAKTSRAAQGADQMARWPTTSSEEAPVRVMAMKIRGMNAQIV